MYLNKINKPSYEPNIFLQRHHQSANVPTCAYAEMLPVLRVCVWVCVCMCVCVCVCVYALVYSSYI